MAARYRAHYAAKGLTTMRRSLLIVVLLVLSLVANALLLAQVWERRSATSESTGSTVASDSHHSVRTGSSRISGNTQDLQVRKAPPLWTQLRQGSLADFRQRLEAAGFPRSVIVDLVAAEIQRSLGYSRARGVQLLADTPYWRNPYQSRSSDETKEDTRRWNQAMEEAFGVLGHSYGAREYFERQYGPLPPEKVDRLFKMESDYAELRDGLTKDVKDPAELSKQFALLEEHWRAELAEILTPEELHEHELRTSPARYFLTERLHAMSLTEAEYRTLFPAARTMAERHRERFTDPTAARAAEWAMLAELEPHARAALGEARFADYLQAIDPDSERLNKLAARFDLPLSAAAQAAATRRDITARAEALRTDQSLTQIQRADQLRSLHAEATQRLHAALGPRAAEAYVTYDGRWLQHLALAGRE